jgi:putative acyl-CoA dehydrogenase
MTHDVFNQPAPLVDYDAFSGNQPMRDALAFNAPSVDTTHLQRLGRTIGSEDMQAHARLANLHTPTLHTHDRFGQRIDVVEFHPSYHALMSLSVGSGLHGTPWTEGAHAHLQRAAAFMLFTELESSTLCPISMTYAVTPALQGNPAVAAEWGPKLASRAYDPRFVPAAQKTGVTMGMGMTEKQGGSDVRANTTQAVHDGREPRRPCTTAATAGASGTC